MTLALTRPSEPVRRYNRTAMILHWLVAALLVVNIAYGLVAAASDKAQAQPIIDTHKSIGLTVLGLVLLRLLWRFGHPPPPLPRAYGRWEKVLAHAAHGALYATMLLLPLSGYLHDSAWVEAPAHPLVWFGLVHLPRMPILRALDPATKDRLHDLFGAAHLYFGFILYGLVGLHLVGVAKHHVIDHEGEIGRMLPTFGAEADAGEPAGRPHP